MHNKVAHRAHRARAKPHKEIYKATKSGFIEPPVSTLER